jgi:hypothetical protein
MDLDLSVLLAATTAYGAVVTKLVDLVRNTLGKENPAMGGSKDRQTPGWVWQVLAFGFGVVIAFVLGVNAFTGERADTALGTALTGLAIGAAGSGFHEIFDALSGTAKAGKAAAPVVPGAQGETASAAPRS